MLRAIRNANFQNATFVVIPLGVVSVSGRLAEVGSEIDRSYFNPAAISCLLIANVAGA